MVFITFRVALEAAGLDSIVLWGLHGLEVLLFICDLFVTVTWAIISTLKTIKEIKEE